MKIKNWFIAFGCCFSMISCGTTSSQPSSIVPASSSETEIPLKEEDIRVPTSTKLEYTDYGELDIKADYDETKWYRNDLEDVPLPDPYVIEVDDVYYIYGTTDRTGSQTMDCFETVDFNTYKCHQNIYVPAENVKPGLFAPEVVVFDDVYYLYYSAVYNNRRYITVATSDSPTGPFVEYKGKDAHGNDLDGSVSPIFSFNDDIKLDVLDQTVFIDDDGKMYMYYSVYHTNKMQYIIGVEMIDPVTADWDTYKILVRPGELSPTTLNTNLLIWEAYKSFKVAEGPQMIKSPVNGKYYLTYSVNHYPDRFYTVCYAVSDAPLGDYTKPYTKGMQWTNLLFGYAGGMNATTVHTQWEGFASGTAHHCFFKVGDEYMIGYHAHRDRKNSDSGRMFGLDHLYFNEEGVPFTHGPTYSLEPLPEQISGYKNVALNARVRSINVTNQNYVNDNFIVEHYNLKQESDKEVILGAGKSYIEITLDKEYSIGGISVYNSAFFEKALSEIRFIDFGDENVILNGVFQSGYFTQNDFIFPCSAFNFDFEDIRTNKVIIGFEATEETQINEISILGKEI